MKNPLENAQNVIESVLEKWVWSPGFRERILQPERVIETHIPVKMDDGTTRIFTGYRSQHNNARGPYKWGIRFHTGVTKEEVMALSIWMSIKTSALDLPLGGGKWGIIVDPKTLSEGELERLSRGFVKLLFRDLWPELDVPAPDVNTNGKIMAWMTDEYQKCTGSLSRWVCTGKPVSYGGSLGRDIATALGGIFVLEERLRRDNESLKWYTFAIQWAGNAGINAGLLIEERGGKVVAISDSKWAIYDENGIDMWTIEAIKKRGESVTDLPIKKISDSELLALPVFCLIPAALESQITAENAHTIRAQFILELANGPITPEAEDIISNKTEWRNEIIPDVLANAGGVTVSYYEQVQNASNYFWSREEVLAKLKTQMTLAASEIIDFSTKNSLTLRKSAYTLALRRIEKAMTDAGTL